MNQEEKKGDPLRHGHNNENKTMNPKWISSYFIYPAYLPPFSTCTTHLGVKFTPPHHTEMSTGLYSLPEIYDLWFFLFTVRGGK